MIRPLLSCLFAIVSGCSIIAPAQQMPAFGDLFEPVAHTSTAPDTATLIIYRDQNLEDRIKPWIMVGGVDTSEFYRGIGYSFAGAFLREEHAPGRVRVNAAPHWWDEDPPAGETFLGRMNVGEPPAEGAQMTKPNSLPLEIDLEAGSVTYIKLIRSSRSELAACRETTETVTVCRVSVVTTAFELVPQSVAQADLAELRETIY